MSKLYGSPPDSQWGKHAFRLLQIYPSSDSTAGIETHLFNASLDDPPQYEALSYRWESSDNKRSIRIDGMQFFVSSNLYSAMLQLRYQSGPKTGTFWIDQVCIDQASILDRNNQVQLMGLIYSRAELVRIWLGLELDDATKAFELVTDCAQLGSHCDTVKRVSEDETGTKALIKLLQRSYWNRMWVFQEIVLAKQAIVHCGRQQAQWSFFSRLDKISADHELWLTAQSRKSWILDLREALFRIAHFCINPDQTQYINNVLLPTRHLQCQDPRDKLYALGGVCGSLANIITPDYSVPARDVYTAFAHTQIKQDGNLCLLLTAGPWDPANGEDIQLPSWVPDLRGMGSIDIRYLAGSFIQSFEASNVTNATFDFQEIDGHFIIEVEAMLLDSIQLYQNINSSIKDDEKHRQLIMNFCLAGDGKTLSTGKLRHYFQAMVFEDSNFFGHVSNTDLHAKKRMENLVLGFLEELQRIFGWQPIFVCFADTFRDLGIDFTMGGRMKIFDRDRLHYCRMEYLNRAYKTTNNQDSVIYTTVHGRIGIGTRSVNQGDQVAVVRGSRVPLILRRKQAYYMLIGPSYVSGVMERKGVSEAVKALQGKLSYETIQII